MQGRAARVNLVGPTQDVKPDMGIIGKKKAALLSRAVSQKSLFAVTPD